MRLHSDALRHKVNMDDDSSSDWDSLTEPAPKLPVKAPPTADIDSDDDTSQIHNSKEKKSATPSIIPPQQSRTDSPPVWTPRKAKTEKAKSGLDVDFRPSLNSTSPQNTPSKRPPGKDRKGNTYDPPRNSPSHKPVSLNDSDEDSLAGLRKTYEQNRPRNAAPLAAELSTNDRKLSTVPEARDDLKSPSGSSYGYGAKPQATVEFKSGSHPTSPAKMATGAESAGFHSNGDHQITVVVDDDHHHGNQERSSTRRSDDSPRSNRNLLTVDGGGAGGPPPTGTSGSSDSDKNMQIYYFEEPHTDYYLTKPERSTAVMEGYADRLELVITRGWKEVFGALRIVVLFITVFLTELVKFTVGSCLRPLYVTAVIITGDRLIKPFFSALFNSILQPFLILIYNSALGVKLALGPILDIFQKLTNMVASLLNSFRLVAISHIHHAKDANSTVVHGSAISVV